MFHLYVIAAGDADWRLVGAFPSNPTEAQISLALSTELDVREIMVLNPGYGLEA